MTTAELDTHCRKIYRILNAKKIEYGKQSEGDPLHSELVYAQEALEALVLIREELRGHLPQEIPAELPSQQPTLLDVPRKGGY